ncbi:MAG TPA: amino acid ABC transporter permease [Trueperaceae bacterium]|nr:amino acid ABC transporter permease [Trueperaceae bacterium]
MFGQFGWHALTLLLIAARWTVLLSALAFALGGLAGFAVALLRTAPSPVSRTLTAAYIEIVQGTPVLILLFVAYFGVALIGIDVPPLLAASIALTIFSSAYLGEIWRGAIDSIAQSQWEASESLGMTRWQQLRHIILPQAFRISLPPTVGFLVQLIKNTSVTSLISLVELTREGQLIANATFRPLPAFVAVALIYFVLCFPLSRFSQSLESRLHVGRQS